MEMSSSQEWELGQMHMSHKLYPTAFCNCTSTLDVASINFVEYDLDITTMNEVDESSSDRSHEVDESSSDRFQWKAPPVRVEPMNE